MPYESFPPFAIIVGAITAMGGVHYAVQMLYEGKPKPVGQDNFDRLMKYRDERVRAEAKVRDDSLGSTERRRPPVAIPSRGRGRSDLGFLFVSARASDHLALSLSLSSTLHVISMRTVLTTRVLSLSTPQSAKPVL